MSEESSIYIITMQHTVLERKTQRPKKEENHN